MPKPNRELPDPILFEEARRAAQEIPEIMRDLIDHIRNEDWEAINQTYVELRGRTVSSGTGLFAALDVMTPQSVTPIEAQWFRKAARLCTQIMNSVLKKPLNYSGHYSAKDFQEAPVMAAKSLTKLSQTIGAIQAAFPAHDISKQ